MSANEEGVHQRPNASWAELLRKLNALPPPPWSERRPWRSPPAQDWVQATHHELIQQLLAAHEEIARLKGGGGNEDPSIDAPSEEEIEQKLYPPSPLVTSPPYEHIVLSERNEARMLLYVNPRLEQAFWTSQPYSSSSRQTMTSACSSLLLCFDESTTDTELQHILSLHPPITHTILRRKTRAQRGSSVPSIDSYYGTDDLHKVGHASYFMPLLTPRERGALGWKSEYVYGKWTYRSSGVLGLESKTRSSVQSIDSSAEHGPRKSGVVTHQTPDLGQGQEAMLSEKPSSSSVFSNTLANLRRFMSIKKPLRWIAPCFFQKDVTDEDEEGVLPVEEPRASRRSLRKHHQWRASVLGGDILDCNSETTTIGPHRRPPPILIPVLSGKENVWFLGTQIPADHAVLLDELRSRRQKPSQEVTATVPEKSGCETRPVTRVEVQSVPVKVHPVSHRSSDFRNMNNQPFLTRIR